MAMSESGDYEHGYSDGWSRMARRLEDVEDEWIRRVEKLEAENDALRDLYRQTLSRQSERDRFVRDLLSSAHAALAGRP
jgi:hypothetical protein